MAKELVIKAPEGFEFVDDGTGEVFHTSPVKGQWILAFENGGKTRAVRSVGAYYSGTLFPLLRKKQDVVSGGVLSTRVFSVGDIYGRSVTIPKGWRYLDFRELRQGDSFILLADHQVAENASACQVTDAASRPRIIVTKED